MSTSKNDLQQAERLMKEVQRDTRKVSALQDGINSKKGVLEELARKNRKEWFKDTNTKQLDAGLIRFVKKTAVSHIKDFDLKAFMKQFPSLWKISIKAKETIAFMTDDGQKKKLKDAGVRVTSSENFEAKPDK